MLDRRTLLAGLLAWPALAEEREGGIGGTGIVGTVTGLEPLSVNGLEAPAAGAVLIDPLARRARLDIGRSVSAVVSDGRAVRVQLTDPLVGTWQSGRVNGVAVQPEPGLRTRVRDGARVVVSGLWREGAVVATRIGSAPDGPDLVAGAAHAGRIGSVPMPGLPEEGFVTALGRWTGDAFAPEALQAGRFGGGTVSALSAEGYLEPVARAPGWRIEGLGHSFAAQARPDAGIGRRAIFEGPYRAAFELAAILLLPDDPAARRAMLATRPPLMGR